MVHKVDDTFVASSGSLWIPGVYESERAAKYAFRFEYSDLHQLQREKNKTSRVITFKDLQELRIKQREL